MPHTPGESIEDGAPAAARPRRIIFVTEKWYEGEPERGDFACLNIVLDSLTATGLATYTTLWVDQHYREHGRAEDRSDPAEPVCE